MLKKGLSSLAMMCIMVSLISISYAIPGNNLIGVRETYGFEELEKIPSSKIANEFDAIKELGDDDVYEFKKILYEMAKENEIELMKQGIEERRVKAIKSLKDIAPENITDEEARRTGAKMRFKLSSGKLNSREASFSCEWAWDSAPISAYDDILDFVWTSGYTINLEKSKMKVDYEDIYGNYLGSKSFSPKEKTDGGSFTFPQSYYSSGLRGISSGRADVVVTNDEGKNYIEIESNYGHSTWTIVPNFTIDWPSFNFEKNISTMGDDYIYFR